MKLVVLGAGFSGRAILKEMATSCRSMIGTTRSHGRFADIEATGAQPMVFPGDIVSEELRAAMAKATHLVMSIAPDPNAKTSSGDPLLETVKGDIRHYFPLLKWVGYLSTVGVYGNHDGEWVDEATPCKPVSKRSVARLKAEQAWTEACGSAGVALAILRLSGIYGPGRNAFCNLANGKARRLVKPGQVFNRIHVADIAGAAALLAGSTTGGVFNITDNLPSPPQDVVMEAANIMGIEVPPEIDFETADLSPMARSFYGENKRVANARITNAGYGFRFPDYHSGLDALWRGGHWRG